MTQHLDLRRRPEQARTAPFRRVPHRARRLVLAATRPRRSACLALSFLLAAAAASPLHAQWDRERRVIVTAGLGAGPPLYLYHGSIGIDRRGIAMYDAEPRDGSVTMQYRERLERPVMAWAEVAYDPGARHQIALRGSWGRSASRATYTGGHAPPETFDREVRWWDVSLLGRVILHERSWTRLYVQGGPTLSWWHLETAGTGRDALAEYAVAGGAPAEPVRWTDRGWSKLGFSFGAAGELLLSPGIALVGSLEYMSVPVAPNALAAGDLADMRAHTDAPLANLTYDRHRIHRATLGVSFSWTALRRLVRDPGARAVEVLAGRRGSEPMDAPSLAGVQALLAAGDTAAAIAELERRAAAGPEDAAVLGTLGLLLAHTAPTREVEFAQRRRARTLLDRALELDPGNPRYYLGIGKVLEKAGMWTDARRVLSRALDAAARRPDAISPAELAETFYRRGRSLEMRVLEFENLRTPALGALPISTPECVGSGAFCMNWLRPRAFFEAFQEMPELSSVVADRRAALVREYARALELDPAHEGASRGLLGLHARAGEWRAFLEHARPSAAASPADPWAALFLAAGLHWTGDDDAAAPLFARALAGLDAADRAVFEDLRRVFDSRLAAVWDTTGEGRRDAIRTRFWNARDPLFLTPANERRNEHYARVALAELLFGEPLSGRRGWETDRGDILVRYGRPRTMWQVPRDESLILSAEDATAVWEWLDLCSRPRYSGERPGGNPICAPAPGIRNTRAMAGGRWIFWNYDPGVPSFIFEKQLGRARVRHMFRSISAQAAQDAREVLPASYASPFRDAGAVAHQTARFRGIEAGTHQVEIHARVPVQALAADTLVRGLFLFARGATKPVVRRTQRVAAAAAAAAAASYRLTLPPGIYDYSLEAATPDRDAAAVSRGELVVGAYSPARLALSDLLLAHSVRARSDTPATRRELEYRPLRCLAMPEDGRLGVIFEIYGLLPDTAGAAAYRVSVDAGEAPARGLAVRILRGLRDLVRGEDRERLSWERVIQTADADRALEWFELELPDAAAARETTLTVTVTDLADGQSASAVRTLSPTCGG